MRAQWMMIRWQADISQLTMFLFTNCAKVSSDKPKVHEVAVRKTKLTCSNLSGVEPKKHLKLKQVSQLSSYMLHVVFYPQASLDTGTSPYCGIYLNNIDLNIILSQSRRPDA